MAYTPFGDPWGGSWSIADGLVTYMDFTGAKEHYNNPSQLREAISNVEKQRGYFHTQQAYDNAIQHFNNGLAMFNQLTP